MEGTYLANKKASPRYSPRYYGASHDVAARTLANNGVTTAISHGRGGGGGGGGVGLCCDVARGT